MKKRNSVIIYFCAIPFFMSQSTPWPVTGADIAPGSGKIPAQQRYEEM